jgi:lambda family phage portal protein
MFGLKLTRERKPDLYDVLYRQPPAPAAAAAPVAAALPVVAVSALPAAPVVRYSNWDGEKFAGGYGATDELWVDYWTLRARSAELYRKNLYARGLIRRLITNELSTGLHLEATPAESLLGVAEDGLAEWSEFVETVFSIWGNDSFACDYTEARTFGELQIAARREALVAGDVLVVLQQDPRTGMPRVRLVSGSAVQSPLAHKLAPGHRVAHGVELDAQGRHVAFWIAQGDRTHKRLPAFGEKSGRRLAWLVYGTDKRLDDVRGEPLLALVLQSLKEIDRYRDSVQRKATINSMLAMYIKKTDDKPATKAMSGHGATRRGADTLIDSTGTPRRFRTAEHIPGLVLDELQTGEEPMGFPSHGTDEKFGDFEEAILCSIAWANEVPPEIFLLAFSSNYSASQAALYEFKAYLDVARATFGKAFCSPIYQEFLLSATLAKVVKADGFAESARDQKLYIVYGAWVSCDWTGNVKPSVDPLKLAKALELMLSMGLTTYDKASREVNGSKFSHNVKKQARETEALAAAREPMAKLKALERPQPEVAEDEDTEDASRDQPAKRNGKRASA